MVLDGEPCPRVIGNVGISSPISCPSIFFDNAMLYLVGLGLADERDITVKGLDVVKHAERVYLEAYTAILHVELPRLVCRYTSASSSTRTDRLIKHRKRSMDALCS